MIEVSAIIISIQKVMTCCSLMQGGQGVSDKQGSHNG